ncbi:MAG: amidohydrolase family protein [Phycisphaerales bacterium]
MRRASSFRAPPASLARALLAIASAGAAFAFGRAAAQEPPPVAMRPVDVRRDAIVNVTVVPAPGERIADAVVVMKDGWIERVGPRASVEVPAGTTVHDGRGCTVYAGFIDACVRADSAAAARAAAAEQGAHWNAKVTPQVQAAELPTLSADARKELRALGFTAAAVHPNSGIFRGSAEVVLLGDEPRSARTLVADAGTCIAFETGGGGPRDGESQARGGYPGALVGAIALVRQTLADARWHAACEEVWRTGPAGNEPPERSNALSALHAAAAGRQRTWFDATDERNLLRAEAIARESSLDAGFVGSGREYRRLAEVRAAGRPVVVPFDFPKAPDVQVPRAADSVPLRELIHWAMAPMNLAELQRAGVPAAASTVRLRDVGGFARAARRALEWGTTEDELLAALTVNPARMLGIGAIAGEVRPGRVANLVLWQGSPFGEESKVRETWIAGIRNEVEPFSRFPLKGCFTLPIPAEAGAFSALPVSLVVDADERRLELLMQKPEGKPAAELRAQGASFDAARASFTVPGKELGATGPLRGELLCTPEAMQVTLAADDGRTVRWEVPAGARSGDVPARPKRGRDRGQPPEGESGKDEGDAGPKAAGDEPAATDRPERPDAKAVVAAIPRTSPLGDCGVEAPSRPRRVLVEHATVWTAADAGILEDADLLVEDGRIVAVGQGLRARLPADPGEGTVIIDGTGLHLTPGLIDCHSHTGIDGGVNEGTQNVTAEVRIADAVNADDIDWYRQLAGGLVAANQLHGSANPIGGQNSVVKLRWGEPAAAFPVEGAIPGIKFALGENVTRGSGRYPSSRLGVETLIRDRFQAAREWRAAHARHAALPPEQRSRTMPPRPDLELEALAEILEGKRLVHCHSYRQDEIAMLLRIADDFGFKVGTLQHVLEGYKVAPDIARHGAGASSFSDWWAYKMEVMDAIPWNGQMLWKAGVVTSFNSDSDELARRMNTEAAKGVRYGAMPREEAIKLVTINPAKQLRIDGMTGSLEPGKDADFAVWSADPLSVYARCLQTWVDGVRRFDVAEDAAMRARDAATRARLVELAMGEWGKDGGGSDGGGGTRGRRGGAPGGGPPPVDGMRSGSLLVRMLGTRADVLMDQVRSGIDPSAIRPGECGCDRLDSWNAIFEETLGEGGAR